MTSKPQLRSVRADELETLHQLIFAVEQGESQPYLTALEEVEEIFGDEINPAAENLRVVDDGDRLVAWGRVSHSPSGQKLERAFLTGGVHPEFTHTGLGQQLLGWQTACATERLMATPSELEAIVLVDSYEWQEQKHRLLSAADFAPARYFDELQRPVTGNLPEVSTPDGISIIPWLDEHTEPARQVYNVAFLDHWGTTPRSPAAWRSDVIEGFGRRLDLSFVAFDGDQMVGYCLNAHYPQDEHVTGRRDGWVDSVCSLSSHRGRGIASSLITHSLHAFAEAGLDSSMLGVDSDNPTGAYGIYERLGYKKLQRMVSFLKTVRHGQSPVKMY